MDEVHAEAWRMPAGNVDRVVSELVFFLVAQYGEGGDGRYKLVVAESLEAGSGQGCGAEGKSQGETQVGIARLGVVQEAGIKRERSHPGRAECVLLVEHKAQIVRV